MSYPWLDTEIQALAPLISYPPNALLFIDGQRDNAHALAHLYLKALLCLTPQEGNACGHCQSCHLIARDLHPDYLYYRDKLTIAQIRELNAQLVTTPVISARRGVYLGNIDRYDDPALNALLKTLEEPQTHSHFCLSAPNRLAVKPTIASRARPWRVPQPDTVQGLAWLREQQGLDTDRALELLRHHHGNPHAAIHAAPLPPWQLDALIHLCLRPTRENAFLLALESIPGEDVIDWCSEQVAALIHARQLDSTMENWQNLAPNAARHIPALDLTRLHRLHAALCKNRHPGRRQSAPTLAVKALLLETLDPRNPAL